MSNRGGRGNSRKPALPNIAAAGRKKPDRAENDGNSGEHRGSSRGRGRGNNRGRGRGRGGSKSQVIVQTEGTFTMGLQDGILKSNRLNNHGNEEVVGKLDKSVSITKFKSSPKVEIDDDVKSTVSGQFDAAEWESDDDQDKIELYELVKPAFVADLKKGREMPVVLPQKDESQFENLVQVTNKFSVKDPPNVTTQDKKDFSKRIRQSAERVHSYLNEHTNDLMLLQLPASLDVVHQLFNKDTPEEKMEVDDSKQQPSSSTAAQPPPPQQKHCLDGLPTGVEIGKLQLLKNGQTRLVIGDRVMDVQQAIPSQMFETIVQTQTFTKPKQEPGILGGAQSSAPQTGSMTVLGNVGDSFLCTYNVAWDG